MRRALRLTKTRWRTVALALLAIWLTGTVLLLLHSTGKQQQQQLQRQQLQDSDLGAANRLNQMLANQRGQVKSLLAEIRQLANGLASATDGDNGVANKSNNTNSNIASNPQRKFSLLPYNIAVLVLACNRPTVTRTLDQLLKYRRTAATAVNHHYSLIVSQDCRHAATAAAIAAYGDQVEFVQQPDQSEIRVPAKERTFVGYYKIARHFRWALDYVFMTKNYQAAIVVEDDLDISADFYDYFGTMGQLLVADNSLWCISAWNDNGKSELINKNRPDLFYRTDFFPGLGWMLLRSLWLELRQQWPVSYWDDYLRKSSVRKGRQCIRPEVSRTYTFGKIGVSRGQFFDKYLRFIELNHHNIDYGNINITYYTKHVYYKNYVRTVYSAPLYPSLATALASTQQGGSARLEYATQAEFVKLTTQLRAMSDLKDGVPRCGYYGIVPIYFQAVRLFITPKNGVQS